MEITVKRVPGQKVVIDTDGETYVTVARALELADMEQREGEVLYVEGLRGSMNQILSDGDLVSLAKGAKNNG